MLCMQVLGEQWCTVHTCGLMIACNGKSDNLGSAAAPAGLLSTAAAAQIAVVRAL
jgi:hypothetical protein